MWCCRNVPETWRSSVALIAALLFVLPVPAQDAPPKEGEPGAKPPEPKTVEEVLKDSDRIDGLFTLYRDRKTGDLRLMLHGRGARQELSLLHLHRERRACGRSIPRQLRRRREAKVFHFSRYFDRIELVVENTSYYFDPCEAHCTCGRREHQPCGRRRSKRSKRRTRRKRASS